MKHQVIDIHVDQSSYHAQLITYLHESSNEMQTQLRPLVLVCPGGAYSMTSDREADPIALKYLGSGMHAAVLRYSVAPAHFPESLLQLAASIAYLRKNAKEWNIDADRIIVQGFSAGGHLAASLGVFWNQPWVAQALASTAEEIRPNGLILSYPVITSGSFAHQGSFKYLLGDNYEMAKILESVSLEKYVTADTPPTFLWHTATDETVPVENSLMFFQALYEAGVPAELHIFPNGAHGLALSTVETAGPNGEYVVKACESWLPLAINWITYSLS